MHFQRVMTTTVFNIENRRNKKHNMKMNKLNVQTRL